MRTPARWIVAFLPGLPKLGHGQKGLGSLNDPCDCMQHHDFWVASRRALVELFWTPDYPMRALDPNDKLHYWTRRQSCMYSPENEESHRPTALSDCIPGFMMVTIVCMQRHVASGNPERAMDFATELVRLLPFGASCIDTSGWPVTTSQILSYYRRFRRAYAAGPKGQGLDVAGRRERTEQRERDGGTASGWPVWLLREMLWQAGTERSSGRLLGEEAETCPSGSFPHKWRCWLLGVPGASCEEACREAELDFRPFPPSPPPMLLASAFRGALGAPHPRGPAWRQVADSARAAPLGPLRMLRAGRTALPLERFLAGTGCFVEVSDLLPGLSLRTFSAIGIGVGGGPGLAINSMRSPGCVMLLKGAAGVKQ
eukprot:s793_g8.t1